MVPDNRGYWRCKDRTLVKLYVHTHTHIYVHTVRSILFIVVRLIVDNMASAFTSYLIASYDAMINKYVIIGCQRTKCDCKRIKNDFENFVIVNKNSYMVCIGYEANQRKRIISGVLVMLGSYLDVTIRGLKAVEETRPLWGTFIVGGVLKTFTICSTLDAFSLHIKETKVVKSIEWYIYIYENQTTTTQPRCRAIKRGVRTRRTLNIIQDSTNKTLKREGLAIIYSHGIIKWIYKRKTWTSNDMSNIPTEYIWINLLNKANKFTKREVTETEYIDLFTAMLVENYNMNNLANRQTLTPVRIFSHILKSTLEKRIKKYGAGCVKLSSSFENTNSKSSLAIAKSNNFQNQDNPLHDGKSNKAIMLIPNVTRTSNEAVKNSNALTFPSDGKNYYCMLNTKDLKSAGEQNTLCDFVITTEETDDLQFFKFIEKFIKIQNTTQTNTNNKIVVINGFITDLKIQDWDLEKLIFVKNEFGHITTKYYGNFILFSTQASILIKYSEEHDCFFSPAETQYWNIKYPEADLLSVAAKEIGVINIRKTQPPKVTVSINNIKGSVATVTSPFHRLLMENSLGINCFMDINETKIREINDISIISYNNDTTTFQIYYDKLVEKLQLNKPMPPVTETNIGKFMRNMSEKLYPLNNMLQQLIPTTGHNKSYETVSIANNPKAIETLVQHRTMICKTKNIKPTYYHNLELRVCFGNMYGNNLEDGVILDSKTATHFPKVVYNACITLAFKFKTIKSMKWTRFIPINSPDKHESLIGCIITPTEALVKCSKHSLVQVAKIGKHFYYLIQFLPKKNGMYDNINVSHIISGSTLKVIIKGSTQVSIGEGSKVCNQYGQKGVICQVRDLSDIWGIDKYGRKVHAQMIYSAASIFGRVTSGQIYSMCTSDDLAIGPNGELIATIRIYVHTLHPYTNLKVFDMKVDTLTNINGFDSQNLSNASFKLRTEQVKDKVEQLFSLLCYNLKFLTPNDLIEYYSITNNNKRKYQALTNKKRKRARQL